MKRSFFQYVIALFLCLTSFVPQGALAVSSSANFKVYGGQVNPLSGSSSSSNYNVTVGGQPNQGTSSSASFGAQGGSSLTPATTTGGGTTGGGTGGTTGGGTSGGGSVAANPAGVATLNPLALFTQGEPVVVNVGTREATIRFDTYENAVAYLQYGEGDSFSFQTGAESDFKFSHEFTLGGLTPATRYGFTVHVKDTQQRSVESSAYYFSTLPLASSVPNASAFLAQPVDGGIALRWSNPSSFAEVILVRSETSYPGSPSSGTVAYKGKGERFIDTAVTQGKKYFYSLFVRNAAGYYSSGAVTEAQPGKPGESLPLPPDFFLPTAEPSVPSVPADDFNPVEGLPDDEAFEDLIPAVPPALPPDVKPVEKPLPPAPGMPEGPSLLDRTVSLFGYVRQLVNKGLVDAAATFASLNREARDKANAVKSGLVDSFGRLQQDVYATLTNEEFLKLEESLQRPLPRPFDPALARRQFEDFINAAAKLPGDTISRLNAVKNGLVDAAGRVSVEAYQALTDAEVMTVEGITKLTLPLPRAIGYIGVAFDSFAASVAKLPRATLQSLNSVKEGLVDASGKISAEVYRTLDAAQVKSVESITKLAAPIPGAIGYAAAAFDSFSSAVAKLPRETLDGLNSIKKGLVDSTGRISVEVYRTLDAAQIKAVEDVTKLAAPIPGAIGYVGDALESFAFSVAKLPRETKDTLNEIRKGLIDELGNLSHEAFMALTPTERAQVQKVIPNEPLPPVFVPETVAKVTPFRSGQNKYGADWHVFAGTEALLSIPASTFSKVVSGITVTIGREAYVMSLNQTTRQYEAFINAPDAKGKYQVIIQVIYQDRTYEELNKSILVDPYGYVYATEYLPWSWSKPWQFLQKRAAPIAGARVALYVKNKGGEWQMWPANLYNQFNPLQTAADGQFAFVTPDGDYYLEASAQGYRFGRSDDFSVKGSVVNVNVELKKDEFSLSRGWIFGILLGITGTLLGWYLWLRYKRKPWYRFW